MWRLRSRLFEHIIHQEVGFFDRVRTGELMNRLSEVRALLDCVPPCCGRDCLLPSCMHNHDAVCNHTAGWRTLWFRGQQDHGVSADDPA